MKKKSEVKTANAGGTRSVASAPTGGTGVSPVRGGKSIRAASGGTRFVASASVGRNDPIAMPTGTRVPRTRGTAENSSAQRSHLPHAKSAKSAKAGGTRSVASAPAGGTGVPPVRGVRHTERRTLG